MLRDCVDRLVRCGMEEGAAMKICGLYAVGCDYAGLEKFVCINEAVLDEHKEFAKEGR